MLETRNIIVAAPSQSLLTAYEVKLGLKLDPTTSVSDDLLEILIDQASDEIATVCNRVLAKETLIETFRQVPENCSEIFLSHYPLTNVASVTESDSATVLTLNSDYVFDVRTGRIIRLGGTWGDPIVVSYTGGYECPFEIPDGLRRAALLYTREAYYSAVRGDQSVRMLSHKESRVIFFDPNVALRALGAGGGAALAATAAQRAVRNLLNHYTRFAI